MWAMEGITLLSLHRPEEKATLAGLCMACPLAKSGEFPTKKEILKYREMREKGHRY